MIRSPAEAYIGHKHSTESWKFLSQHDRHASSLSWSLLSAITSFSHLAATDERDRIYGLLGIVANEERIEVDYSKDAVQVFWDAMIAIHKRTETLNEHWEKLFSLGLEMGVRSSELFAFRLKHRPSNPGIRT